MATATATATRFPNADFIDLWAKTSGLSQSDIKKAADAFPDVLAMIFKKAGLQELEITRAMVIEERRKSGKLSPELGGKTYNVPVLSARISETLKDAIKIKSNKLIGDIEEELTDEEYEYALSDAA